MKLQPRNILKARAMFGLVVCTSAMSAFAVGRPRHQDSTSRSGRDAVVGITSAIHPSDKLLSTILRPAVYARIAIQLDDAEGIFQRAHYKPVWTQTADEAKKNHNLPPGCTVVPHETRSWEPWFRNTLKNGDKVLSTGDLLLVRDAIALAVCRDPRTQFAEIFNNIPASKRLAECADRLEAVRKDTLHELGVDNPSSTLVQVTEADAVNYWIRGEFVYGPYMTDKYLMHHRWPTGNQLLDNPPLELECGDAADLGVYLIRCIEQKSPYGMKVQALNGSIYFNDKDVNGHYKLGVDGHCMMGVGINCGSNDRINLFYNATPWQGGVGNRFARSTLGISKEMGPINQVLVEDLCTRFSPSYNLPAEKDKLGVNTTNANGKFELGENNTSFSLGNSVPYIDVDDPFNRYRTANDGPITSFQDTVKGIFRF